MTNAARADLALGRMTAVTVVMSLKARRDRLAGAGRIMARRTPIGGTAPSAVMIAVIKFHVKAFDKTHRENLHLFRIGLKVLMTDGTHYLFLIDKLVQMAANTGIMARIVHF